MTARRFLLCIAGVALGLVLFLCVDRANERTSERELKLPSSMPEPPLPVASAELDRAATADPSHAVIAGRCVDERGTPLADQSLELSAEPYRERSWTSLRARSGVDGRFRFELSPEDLFRIKLAWCTSPDQRQIWGWSKLAAAQQIDLGDLRTGGPHALKVAVVDATGQPCAARWTIQLGSSGFEGGGDAEFRSVELAREEPFAEALLLGLPPGRAFVSLRHPTARVPPGRYVDLGAETLAEVRLRCAVAAPEGRLEVRVQFPFVPYRFAREALELVLEAPDGTRHERKLETSPPHSVVLEGLAAVPHVLRLAHPRLPPLVKEGVLPGGKLELEMRGSAALELDVRDAGRDTPVSAYALHLRYDVGDPAPQILLRHAIAQPLPTGSRFDGVFPGNITAVVQAPGYAPCEIDLGTLGENEARRVAVRLSRGAVVRGVVLDALGKPARDCRVILGPRLPGESDARRMWNGAINDASRDLRLETGTDAEGRFAFERVGNGAQWIVAQRSELIHAEKSIEVTGDASHEAQLVLPGEGRLKGRLVGFSGALPARLSVQATALEDVPAPRRGQLDATVESKHGFFLGPLPAGSYRIELVLPPGTIQLREMQFSQPECRRELGVVVLVPGAVTECTFDIAHLALASVEVELAVRGDLPPRGQLILREPEGRPSRATLGARVSEGKAHWALVPCGTWELIAVIDDLTACWTRAEPVIVEAGSTTRVAVDLDVRAGKVRVLDRASGAPRANAEVLFGDALRKGFPLRTDAEGWLPLVLGTGTYEIGLRDPTKRRASQSSLSPFTWSAQDPPDRELRL